MAFSVWAFSQPGSAPEVWRCPNFHPFFLALTVCPYDDGCEMGGRFGNLPNTFPSRISIVCGIRVAETPTRKSIDTHYEEPTSPLRPTARGRAEGAFFVSDFSRASKRTHPRRRRGRDGRQMAARSRPPRRRRDGAASASPPGFICVMLTLMITRLHPLLSRAPRRSHAPSGTRHNPVPLNR